MTNNDTNTLNGALAELGETMAANLTAKGVTSSASEGLTTLAGKILTIPSGGSCYHIEFSEDSYTAVGGSATLEIFLQENYAPKVGATVSVSGSDGSLYTGITNSNGIANVTVSNVSGTVTFTASYSNVSATCTVTTGPTYLFYDDCSADNTRQYSTIVRIGGTTNVSSMAFQSSERAYLLSNTTTRDAFAGWVIPNIRGYDNIRISVKAKLLSNNPYNQLLLGCADTIAYSSTSGTYDLWRIRGDNKSDYLHNTSNEVTGSSSTTSVYNQYVTVVFEKTGTTIVGKVYNSSDTLLRTYTYTSANRYTNPYFFIMGNTNRNADTKYIKEIKVEAL